MGRKIGKIIVVLGMIFLLNNVRLQAEEIPKPYQVKCEQPNGNNEYYTEAPEIEIEHFDQMLITKYIMTFPDGKELTGELNEEVNKVTIPAEIFQEGEQKLSLWMENEEGEKVDGTETEKIFKIDGTAPEDPLEFIYPSEENMETLCFSEETMIEVKAADSVSGIFGIYYRFNEEEEQLLEGETVQIAIPVGFEGSITAYAVDYAGNRGKQYRSQSFICENEGPEILVKAPQGFDHWYNQPVTVEAVIRENGIRSGIKHVVCYVKEKKIWEKYCDLKTEEVSFVFTVHTMSALQIKVEDYAGNQSSKRQQILLDAKNPEIEVLGAENYMITSDNVSISCTVSDEQRVESVSGQIIWKGIHGEEKTTEIQEWKKDGEQYYAAEELSENGVYQLNFQVQDQAGNQSEESVQVIIDKENPIISKIEKLQGKYLPFFRWVYSSEEVVQDFTSYTYAVYLDKRICEPNLRYEEEGQHILEVTAKDAAGNVSRAKAVFTIDHTAPRIIFKNVESGKTYEKEVEAAIYLENEKDMIEQIYIDGEARDWEKTYVFQEPGEHMIKVIATDLAGNRSEEEIKFAVKEKSMLLKEIMKKDIRHREHKETGKKFSKAVFVIIGISLLVMMAVCTGIILKRKRNAKK